ncbi:hypothetical protein F8M41_017435 [Gigaspora margarita]|uniref:Uncharacterized protein n=1 Tax=Gigaspora margarita TaxID=4874 RepID=A0A8H4B5N7_GIGMA|nr:hypothetical protein F8M41_017435 [Gigaspora margarita]
MDYADETKDPRNCHQNGIKVEKETSWNYQKNAEKDIVKSLKELDLEEKSEDDESDNVDDIDETSKEDHNEKNDKKGINKKKQHRASKEWIKKIEELQEKSKWNKEVKRQPEGKLTETNDIPNAGDCYRRKIWASTDVSNDEEEIEVRRHYRDEIEVKIDELYEWHFGSTKEDNLASQFDPGGLCWQKSQLKKIRKEKLVDKINREALVKNNDENDEEKNYRKEKPLEESLHQKWNRRLQIIYKKMDDLHKEAIQNIKHAENGEIVTLKVGDVSERMDIIEAIDSEIVHYLFDPGGSIRPNILCRPKES